MKKLLVIIGSQCLLVGVLLAAGCASSASSQSFPRGSARTGYDVRYGEVVSTRTVEIEGGTSALGRIGGAAIGFAIAMGGGDGYLLSGNTFATAVGGVAGSVAGEAIERRAGTEDGVQIVVQLEGNRRIAVIQASDIEFSPGERVQVLTGRDGSMRVQQL